MSEGHEKCLVTSRRCMSVRHDSCPSEMSHVILTCLRKDISEEGHKTLHILLRHDSCPSEMSRHEKHDSCPDISEGHESCLTKDTSHVSRRTRVMSHEGHESCLRRICNVLCPSSEMSLLRHVRMIRDISEGHESCLTDMHLPCHTSRTI